MGNISCFISQDSVTIYNTVLNYRVLNFILLINFNTAMGNFNMKLFVQQEKL